MPYSQLAHLSRNLSRAGEVALAFRQTPAWRQLSLLYAGLREGPFPYELRLRDGTILNFESLEEVKVFWNIFVRKCYRVRQDDRVIFDAGGNIGMFALWAAQAAPQARIYSFEPWPSSYERLVGHVDANGLSGRVTPLQLALAGRSARRRMPDGSIDSTSRRLDPRDALAEDAGRAAIGGVDVDCMTLADAMERYGIDELDMLKMDIEGGEYEVLLATPHEALRRIRRIQVEYHEVPAELGRSPQQLIDHITGAGHELVHTEEDRFRTGMARFEMPRP